MSIAQTSGRVKGRPGVVRRGLVQRGEGPAHPAEPTRQRGPAGTPGPCQGDPFAGAYAGRNRRRAPEHARGGRTDGTESTWTRPAAAAPAATGPANLAPAAGVQRAARPAGGCRREVNSWAPAGPVHSPTAAAAFSRKSDPCLIYRRTMRSERCPVCCMIARSDTPALAAEVASPARSEWPA